MSHLWQRISPAAIPPGWGDVFKFGPMGAFGVGIFFVLSGFLLSRPFWQARDAGRPIPSLGTFALRRAARILPGYWLALTASFLASISIFGLAAEPQLIQRFWAGFFLVSDFHWVTLFPVETNGPLWSISFEVTSYALLPLCFAALFAARAGQAWRGRLFWVFLLLLVAILYSGWMSFLAPDEVGRGWEYALIGGAKEWMPNINPVSMFAIFAIGALAAGLQVRWARYRSLGFDLLAALGLSVALWSMVGHMDGPAEAYALLGIPHDFPVFPLAIGLALAALPASIILGRLSDNPASRYVAKISFGIYVWHYLVIEITGRVIDQRYQQQMETPLLRWIIVSGIVVAITFAIASSSFKYIENPVIRWARGLEKRRQSGALVQNADGQV